MGKVKIRYYVTHQHPGRPRYGYWSPCLKRDGKPTRMADLGFKIVDCGVDGPTAWAVAESWNAKWDAVKRGESAPPSIEPVYPPNSLGEGYARFKATNEWERKKERTREDWERGWKHIGPIFGDLAPGDIGFEELSLWYSGSSDGKITGLLQTVGVREAHRAMKIWRAMWVVLGAIKNSDGKMYAADKDPSLGIRRETPKPRSEVWLYDEIRKLVKNAWRMKYRGLAAALAVAWDTMLSPIDVVKLTAGQQVKPTKDDRVRGFRFQFINRTKTGTAVVGTLGHKAERVLAAYIASLGFDLHPDTTIFHTRGGAPGAKGGRPRPPARYTRDKLGKDFAVVREATFPGDLRQIIDFRRSGAIEADAGQVDKKALGAKMGNTIETNSELQRTYLPQSGPQTATLVQLADEARARGRDRLRGGANRSGAKS